MSNILEQWNEGLEGWTEEEELKEYKFNYDEVMSEINELLRKYKNEAEETQPLLAPSIKSRIMKQLAAKILEG